jgi:cellulose biosynthesis protein BcsQ
MTKVLAVVNTAGGTGKTITAHALAVACAEYGRRTLLVDFDPRANLTYLLGREQSRRTVTDLLRGEVNLESVVQPTDERFSFVPSNSRLARLESDDPIRLSQIFRKALEQADPEFDLVILDTASSISNVIAAAIAAADFLLGVTADSMVSVRGVLQSKELAESLATEHQGVWLGALPIHMSASNPGLVSLLNQDMRVWEPAISYSKGAGLPQRGSKSIISNFPASVTAENYRELAYFLLEEL